jgi:uncharacterized protein YndB with AHSA1/START domain
MIDTTRGFTLTREFDATPEQLWRAWTDPDEAARWWHPMRMHTPRESVRIDARVGGRYAYTMVHDETGEEYPTGGEYREVEPFSRLVFTWGEPDSAVDDTPVITLTFEPVGDRTRMTLDLRGVDPVEGDADFRTGWEEALDSLDAYADRS